MTQEKIQNRRNLLQECIESFKRWVEHYEKELRLLQDECKHPNATTKSEVFADMQNEYSFLRVTTSTCPDCGYKSRDTY